MSVLSKEDFMNSIKGRVGEDTSDEAIKFIEDMTYTFNDLTNRIGDKEDWKTKYEENDKAWKQKYRDRFFNTEAKEEIEEHEKEKEKEMEIDEPKKLTFDALFKTEDGSTN